MPWSSRKQITTHSPKRVTYKGITYYQRRDGSEYFWSGKRGPRGVTESLHRRKWEDRHGPIPEGMEVHHVDGDKENNDVSNLALRKPTKHLSEHSKERWADPKHIPAMRAGLEKAIALAPAWHRSKEGLAWHSKNGKDTWLDRKKESVECVVCGDKFETVFFNRETVRFCSISCERKNAYRTNRTQRSCKMCLKPFMAYKYRKQTFCSYSCSSLSRGKNSDTNKL